MLTPESFGGPARAAVRERLRADMAARDSLATPARRALDGLWHALRPDAMDPALPERHLLAYDLHARGGPVAVVAAGDPAPATHVTWMVSGMGIGVQTAMWGAAHEAALLAAAQRAAGAPRPAVLAWLGHAAPTPWRALLDAPARDAGRRLAEDVTAWTGFVRDSGLRAAGTAVHGAMDAHSYGTLVAAHALRRLAAAGLQSPLPGVERPVEALTVSGAVGLPAALAAGARLLGLPDGRVFQASAPGDVLAWLGRRGGRRRPWPGAVPLPVAATAELVGAAVRGHDTSRWRPEAGEDAPRGYRDAGSVTLAGIARVTAGQPLPSLDGVSGGRR